LRARSTSAPKALIDATVAYATSALRYIRANCRANLVHSFESYRIHGPSATLVKGKAISFLTLGQRHAHALERIPEVETLKQAMPEELRSKAGRLAIGVIEAYLRDRVSFRYDPRRLSKCAEAYAQMWATGRFELVSLSLISGVEVNGTPMKLDQQAKLTPVTDKDRSNLFAFSSTNDVGVHELQAVKAFLVVRTSHSLKEMFGDYGRLFSGIHTEQLQRALTALQLAFDGTPRHQRTYTWFEPRPFWDTRGSGSMSLYRFPIGKCPILNARARRQTRDLYEALADKKASKLDVAFRRLGSSFEKRLPEDVIVDLVIALEVTLTLTANAGADNLAKQMQQRALALAADLIPTVDSDLALLYKVRGRIVHQGWSLERALKDSNSTLSADSMLERARELVRCVLSRYLLLAVARQMAPADINTELDRGIRLQVAGGAKRIRDRILRGERRPRKGMVSES
jgi:hypothetical protein